MSYVYIYIYYIASRPGGYLKNIGPGELMGLGSQNYWVSVKFRLPAVSLFRQVQVAGTCPPPSNSGCRQIRVAGKLPATRI